jgi:short-subunit dehydrogenase
LPDHALYGGSKIVPQYLVEALPKELGHRGVTVNSTRACATVVEAPGSHAIYISQAGGRGGDHRQGGKER